MEKVLEGVNVLEMCVAAAGPSCGRMLVDFGATDIMVEPVSGQSSRYTAPHSYDFKCGGKQSIPIDLKSKEGKEIFFRLVRQADVFLSNFRTGALERLGFTYEKLSEINPRLIYATLNGFGDKGPMKDAPGFDATAWWAKTGMLVDIAQPDSIIQIPYGTGDFCTGHSLALGICAALFNRERTGKGTKVSTSIFASGIFENYHAIIESQYGLALPSSRKRPERSMLNTYRCSDGEWISMNATHHWDVTWPALCKFIDREDLIEKYPDHASTAWEAAPELVDILDREFAKHTSDEAVSALGKCGTISIVKAAHSIDVIRDRQALENEYIVEFEDSEGRTIMHPTTPVRIGDDEPAPLRHGPKLGEDTIDIMKRLGYTDEQISEYRSKNIIAADR